MSYWVFSEEGFPNIKMLGKAGYTPEYIQWNGIQVVIPKQEWIKLDDIYRYRYHENWTDTMGKQMVVTGSEVADYIKKKYENRGVIVLDHEPSDPEIDAAPKVVKDLNLEYRRKAVMHYESERDKVANGKEGRVTPTPYEDECYDLLGIPKPYSLETLRDQRRPGEAATERLAAMVAKMLEKKEAPKAVEA